MLKQSTNIILFGLGLACLILIGVIVKQRSDIAEREKAMAGLKRERDLAWKSLAGRESEIKGLKETVKNLEEERANTVNQENELDSWIGKVTKLKNFINKRPEYAIPEFKFLTTRDWLAVTEGRMESEADYRKVLADLRQKAKTHVFDVLRDIIEKFPDANNGQNPRGMEDIIKYLPADFDSTIIERWVTIPSGQRHFQERNRDIIKEAYLVDDIWEFEFTLSEHGGGMISHRGPSQEEKVLAAISQYRNEYGREPANSEEILKYIEIDEDRGRSVEKIDKIYKAIMTPVK